MTGRATRARLGQVAVTLAAVALAWQVAAQALAVAAPIHMALRLAPSSPGLLARAAEAELKAGRGQAARALARRSLAAAPFNGRALRVLGVELDRAGEPARGEDLVTLAGNWNLRDRPAHAWLMDRRLRQGDYPSAFAHADALLRGAEADRPQLFGLLTAALAADPRAAGAVAGRLAQRPPWRGAFLAGLNETPEGLQGAADLALAMAPGPAPFDDREQGALLTRLVRAGGAEAAVVLRQRLRPGAAAPLLADGEFDGGGGPEPFRWVTAAGPGGTAETLPLASGRALRVEYDGYSAPGLVRQLVALPPGAYRLRGRWRADAAVPQPRLAWTLACADGPALARGAPTAPAAGPAWRRFEVGFEVPAQGCAAQWLRLSPVPGERRATVAVWYDGLSIERVRS